jgi:hypothetical protein
MYNPLPYILLGAFVLALVLLISGMIRLRQWGRHHLNETRRLRFDLGKLADEVAQLRKDLASR